MRERLRVYGERLRCHFWRSAMLFAGVALVWVIGENQRFMAELPLREYPSPQEETAVRPCRRARVDVPRPDETASVADPFGLSGGLAEMPRSAPPPAEAAVLSAPGVKRTAAPPRLVGIVGGAAGHLAIFSGVGGSILCGASELVDGYRVLWISEREVALADAAGVVRLEVGR